MKLTVREAIERMSRTPGLSEAGKKILAYVKGLERAGDETSALVARVQELEERIENAQMAMSETASSWESRCHFIMGALGFNYGDPPDDDSLKERALRAEAENKQAVEVMKMLLNWAGKRCPCENETPDPCPLCGAGVANLQPCMAAENTIPSDILRKARAALKAMEATDE